MYNIIEHMYEETTANVKQQGILRDSYLNVVSHSVKVI